VAGVSLKRQEPDLGTPYYLYRPSYYDPAERWPLLVVCHAWPFDGARAEMLEWADLAESKGVLLLAPKLGATHDWADDPAEQVPAQRTDERVILSAIKHVQAACRVADEQIAIIGSEGGARTALFAGLRNPELFRVVALLRPRFDVQHVSDVGPRVDPYQRVLVVIGMGDWQGEETDDCLEWLREQDLTPTEVMSAATRRKYQAMVYRYLRDTLARHPWIRVRAFETDSPLGVRFAAETSLDEVRRFEWEFGDGQTDVIASPEHHYQRPGEYDVTVKIFPHREAVHVRRIRIAVPVGYGGP